MFRLFLLLSAVVLVLTFAVVINAAIPSVSETTGCWVGEYTDDIKLDSVTYTVAEGHISEADVEEVYGVISKRWDPTDCDRTLDDGEATVLSEGTLVYALDDYNPAFRVAARYAETFRLYEAVLNPNAERGAEMYDIAGKVRSVTIRQIELKRPDEGLLVAAVTDAVTIERIVSGIGEAVRNDFGLISAAELQHPYELTMELEDETTFRILYWSNLNMLSGSFAPAAEFHELMAKSSTITYGM